MKLSGYTVSVLLMAGSAYATSLQARQVRQPDQPGSNATVQIQSVAISTSTASCPPNSYSISYNADRSQVTVKYSAWQMVNAKNLPADIRPEGECELLLNLQYLGGYTESTVDYTIQGFAVLRGGVSVFSNTEIAWSGSADRVVESRGNTTLSRNIQPSSDWSNGKNYTLPENIATQTVARSACGGSGTLRVKTRVGLRYSGQGLQEGIMTVDNIDLKFRSSYRAPGESCTP